MIEEKVREILHSAMFMLSWSCLVAATVWSFLEGVDHLSFLLVAAAGVFALLAIAARK